MTERVERMQAKYEVLGHANQAVIELCRNHCQDMTFAQDGSGGLLEAQKRLPVGRRHVICPVANGRMSGMNLELVAEDFYAEHCVGCPQRRPTGFKPNLATEIERKQANAHAAKEGERARTEQRHRAWSGRAERRRALRAGTDPATASVLEDFGILDIEPGAHLDRGRRDEAISRLTALAERTPHAFAAESVEVAVLLVEQDGVSGLLAPLRRIAHARPNIAPQVLEAAFAALRRGPDLEAGRCVSDLLAAPTDGLDNAVARSLVLLAGAPDRERIGHYGPATSPRDASGLRAAASHTPDTVAAVLAAMLPAPVQPTSLSLPLGVPDPSAERQAGDFDRASAATAITTLAKTHPGIAAALIETMARNLGVEPEDDYDKHAVGCVQRALATLYLLNIGDVHAQIEQLGRSTGNEHRERLFAVTREAVRLLDPKDRFRAPSAPNVDQQRRQAAFEQLISTSVTRTGCDWGPRAGAAAARLLITLAELDTALAYPHVKALFGAFLSTIDRLAAKPAASVIAVDPAVIMERAFEQAGAGFANEAIARDLLSAVARAAGTAPAAVCTTAVELITNERDGQRGTEAITRLLRLVGDLGTMYGDQPGIVQKLLPTLHTYLNDPEVGPRAEALKAWTNIGARHPVPSSLGDLLPVLTQDRHLGVISALLDAARSLTWPQHQREQLLAYALLWCASLDGKRHQKLLLKAMWTILCLTDAGDQRRTAGEQLILERAGDLDEYGLREILQHAWPPAFARSEHMAQLQLRHVREYDDDSPLPEDRDVHWCALLECGPGLSTVSTGDLISAAIECDLRYPLASARYAEVVWRAGRPGDAAAVIRRVAQIIPQQPAFAVQRAITDLLIAAAEFDAADLDQLEAQAHGLAEAVKNLEATGTEYLAPLARAVRATATARLLLADQPIPDALQTGAEPAAAPTSRDPAIRTRARADQFTAAGDELVAAAQQATATAEFCRMIGELCTIAKHLLYREAAELDADAATAQAHAGAARLRAHQLDEEVAARFAPDDPLAAPLRSALAVLEATPDPQSATLLPQFAQLHMPTPVIRGPEPATAHRPANGQEPEDEAREHEVAVVLASLNGKLITGPTVVHPGTAYSLSLEVHPGVWPDWADHLEAEIVSHFADREVETSPYRWARPLDANSDLREEGTLVVRFGLSAGQPAPPFLISLHWSGTQDGQPTRQAIDVAGHRELRIRPYDSSRDALVGHFPAFDERLLSIYEGLHDAGYNDDHLQAFCRLFTAICRAGLAMTWSKQYKRGSSVSERKFHNDLDTMLRGDPDLGGRVERGNPLALGYLDMRHDGITAELKVERKTPVTETSAPKYLGQPTQYAAADGARLSILCILDMSPKILPIGTPENYVFTLRPELHGLTNPEAPSLTAVIIVNGNLPAPSSYSRRRIAIRP